MMPTDSVPVRATPSATIAQALGFAQRSNPPRLDEVIAYLRELWRLAEAVGYDPALLAAQSAYETAVPGQGPWRSAAWEHNLNPAGIGVTDTIDVSVRLANGVDAARLHVQHMAGYVEPRQSWAAYSVYVALDPRWHDLTRTDMAGTVANLEDLGGGAWATQAKAQYGVGVRQWLAQIRATAQPGAPDAGPVVPADARALLPDIVWVEGCTNYHARPNGMAPRFLVRHITDDLKLENTISWFRSERSQASSHFVIDGDGTVYQLVSSRHAAWTNGDHNRPRTDIPALSAALAQVRAGTHNLNDFCVTIEHVGKPDRPITPAQVEASIALGRYFNHPGVYGIPPHRYGQLRHSDINSVSRSYCPGSAIDLAAIIRAQGGDPTRLRAA